MHLDLGPPLSCQRAPLLRSAQAPLLCSPQAQRRGSLPGGTAPRQVAPRPVQLLVGPAAARRGVALRAWSMAARVGV